MQLTAICKGSFIIWRPLTAKSLLIMKLLAVFLLATCLQASATAYAQKINLHQKNASLQSVLQEIERQTSYQFFYNERLIKSARKVNVTIQNASLEDALKLCFKDQPFTYTILDQTIIINKEETPSQPAAILIDISGRVTDETGNPLSRASVTVKGTSIRTTTNENGEFKLSGVGENAVLEVTYVGYTQKTVNVNSKTSLTITLQQQSSNLETIVVTYGNQRKKEVVGSVSQLKASDIKDQPTGTFAERLQGKFPGVQTAQVSGRPGQGIDIRIRGAASISASNRPLVVIDGIPVLGDPDAINNINPDEIETFSVLKDAAATSLYGSRAANGVVLITTKRGKAGLPKVDFNAYYGVATLMRELKPEVMNATELATYMKGFYEDKIRYEGYTGGIPPEYQNPAQYGEGTDWYNLLMRNAPVQNYNVSVSTGNEKSALSIIGGYFNQDGIMKNTGYKRYSLRINGDVSINKNIKVGANLAPSLQEEHNNRQGNGFNIDGQRAILASTLMMPPMASPYNPDGSLTLGYAGGFSNLFVWPNPLRQLLEINDNSTRLRLLANLFTEISFLEDFKFKTSISTDVNGFTRKKFVPSTSRGGFSVVPIDNAPPGNKSAYGEANMNNNYSWINENTLSYEKTIHDHSVRALVGLSAQRWNDYRSNIVGEDFPDNSIQYLNTAARFSTVNSTSAAWSLLSLFGTVNYNFKGKYFLQGSIRRDGSSRFGFDNKWGTFPSIGAGWVVSDEPFMKGLSNTISFLKIRGSYGLTGNNEIGDYTSISTVSASNYAFTSGLASGKAQTNFGNSLLSWEKNKQLDIGLEMNLFNDRISISYDYYKKKTNDLLYQVLVPRATGFVNVWANIGAIRFWGHEVSINSKNLTGAFKWSTNFNISFNRNIVEKLGATNAPIAANPTVALTDFTDWKTVVGQPLGQFYGYIFDGVFMNQAEFDAGAKYPTARVGTVRMKDLNGDKLIDAANDRTFIGNPNPDFIFGISNNFFYKNFDLSITASGTYGNEMKNSMTESLYNMDGVFNGPKELLNRWRSEQDPGNGRIQRTLAGSTVLSRSDNSFFIYDASHLTINNVTLGYTFKIPHVKSLRIYGGVQNAYIFTSYKGNPETSSGGLNGISQGEDIGGYPVPRTYTLGINLGL